MPFPPRCNALGSDQGKLGKVAAGTSRPYSIAADVLSHPPICLDVAFFLGSLSTISGLSSSLRYTSETVRRHFKTPFIYSAVGGLKSGFMGVRMKMSSQECQMLPKIQTSGSKPSGNIQLVEADNRLYAFTELVDNVQKCYALQQYDVGDSTWKPCNFRRYGELDVFVRLDSFLYVFGKSQRDSPDWPLVVDRYDCGSGTADSLPAMPTPRTGAAVVTVDARYIYVLGGHEIAADGFQPLATVERYDTKLNMWESLPPMLHPRRVCKAVVVNGQVHVIGGLGSHGPVAIPEAYDPVTKRWTALEPMPTPRSAVQLVEHRGQLYAFGGTDANGAQTMAVERFDAHSNSWSTLPDVGCDRDVASKHLGVSVLTCYGRLYTLYTEASFHWPEPQVVLRRYHEERGPDVACYRLFSCSSHICAAVVSECE